LKLETFTIRDRDSALLDIRFDRLPSRHPYLLMLPQNATEDILANEIAKRGGAIHRGVAATSIVQGSDGAQVTVSDNGRERCISARYVVGADGMHSAVREATGIAFEGETYGDSFVLADVHLQWPLGRDEVSLFFSPDGLVVVAPLPDGSYRVVATLDNAPEHPAIADIQALLDRRGPEAKPAQVIDMIWSSRFRVHHRIARSYRNGRLILMGDAAHVHSPAGGQGMNTGLIDAVVLGDLLAGILRKSRPESDLDLYQETRRPAALQVLALAGRLTGLATMRNPMAKYARNAAFWVVDHNPVAKRRIAMNLSGLSRASLAHLPLAS
jgi:2-polyprenyl-6-methoxyphenol hydroxylase-like FAD-dependent oxidoreductase